MQTYQQGIEKYPAKTIFIENFLLIAWIIIGTTTCWLFKPLTAWLYLASAIIMVYIVLRKLLCANCYYYNKFCHVGWGKFTALFFKKGNTKNFNNIGQILAPLTYFALIIIPLIIIIILLIQEFTIYKIILLILLILLFLFSGLITRKKSCAKCKMRLYCKGCATKIKK